MVPLVSEVKLFYNTLSCQVHLFYPWPSYLWRTKKSELGIHNGTDEIQTHRTCWWCKEVIMVSNKDHLAGWILIRCLMASRGSPTLSHLQL